MKSISELRSEIESRSASTVAETNFGADLVGRLLSPDEVEMVAGGDGTDATCYSGSTTHGQSGSGSYTQTGESQYGQTGAGSYNQNCT